MIPTSIKKLAWIGIFFYLPFVSMAWGVEGHRIVGEIADGYLTKKAKKEIIKILGTESIAMASNWADFVKSDSSYNYLSNWHYINFKSGLSANEIQAYLNKDTATDAYTKINFLVVELKKKELSPEKKTLYLRLLVHLVGDIHQPMHTGRLEDLGGNKIRVLWFNDSKNLHQLWDDQLIQFQQLSYTEYARAINHTTPQQRNEWQQEPVSKWIYESYQLAEKIYSEITLPNQKLDYKYNFNYVEILNRQLLKGGVHLAGLLNEIFK
ncbi:MAG: S1/P1 nuclease [Ferruginibacter sp.]|nr:S1/P1 nuclease [Ferruginibacter sp.]